MDSISPCFESKTPKIESSQNVFAEKLGSISPKKYRKSIHVIFLKIGQHFPLFEYKKGRPPPIKFLGKASLSLKPKKSDYDAWCSPPALPPSHSHARHRPFGPLVSAKDGSG